MTIDLLVVPVINKICTNIIMSVTNVAVNLDVVVDATGNISVFGETAPVMTNVVVANTQLPITNFYKNSDDSLIRFQGTNISGVDKIVGFLDQNFSGSSEVISSDIKQVLNGTFNCTNATPFSVYPTNDYKTQNSFGDLALAAYAHALFGHVAATAAISNDAELISKMNGDGTNDAQLNIKLANAISNLSNDKCSAIARQVIGQDASRAMYYDNDSNTPNLSQALEFRGGDVIYVSIRLQQPTVTVTNNVVNAPVATDYTETVYVLKITLSAVYSAPSIVYTPDTLTFTQGTALTKTYYPTNTGGRPDSFSISPSLPAGLVINSVTGGISGTSTVSSPNTLYVVTAASTTPSSTFLTIKVDPSTPNITYPTPQSFLIGTPISNLSPTNTGGYAASYSAPILPSGLSINTVTGVISGTPNAITATNDYSVTATNVSGISVFNINMTVEASTPNISYTTPVTFTQGSAITPLSPTNTGGSVTSYSATLPAGLSINTTTGVITGTPSTVFSATDVVITASNATSSATFTINMTSRIPVPSISYSTPDTYVVGTEITPDVPTNTGGAGTYSADSLPAGLSVDPTTGVISGTPTTVTANGFYTIRATNSTGVGTTQVEIAVNPVAPNFSYPASPVVTNNNVAITPIVPETNGISVTSWSVSPTLPTGLSINNITGEITGTPSQEVTNGVYVITGTNVTGTSTANITLTINRFVAQPPNITYTSPHQLTNGTAISDLTPTNTGGDVQASGYSVSPALPTGLTLNTTTGVISGTPTTTDMTSKGYTVSATNTYGTGSYQIMINVYPALPNLQYESPYIFIDGSSARSLEPYNAGGPATSVSISPALPPNLVIDANTGRIYGMASGIIAAANYTVTATNQSGSTTSIVNLRINPLNPNFYYENMMYTVTVGVAISPINPVINQGPIDNWAMSAGITLPDGLVINQLTGTISGTPTTTNENGGAYEVTGTNVAGSFIAGVQLKVQPPPPTIAYTSPSTAIKGSYYSNEPVNNGGPITSWSIDKSLPAGLNWNGTNGTIAGYASAETVADDYVITASNVSGTSTFTLRLSVGPPLPTLSYTSPNVYKVGDPVTLAPTTSQAGTTYTAASLPAGMAIFTNTGVITGTPSEIKSARLYTVTATNISGSTTFDVSITVNPALPVISYSSPKTYYNTIAITPLTPTSSGGAVDSYSGTLPAGLTLNTSTGVITGTPSGVASAADYTITATNVSGSATAVINITIDGSGAAPPVFSYAGSPFTFNQNTSVSALPTSTGVPVVSYSTSGLPGSLLLNTTTGEIYGEAMNVVTNGSYDITATNSNGSTTTTITITIVVAPPSISYVSPQSFYMNNDIGSIMPTNTGGAGYFASSPELPPGININTATGEITGACTTQLAATNYTITADNASGESSAILNLAFTRLDGVGSFKWATAFAPDTQTNQLTGVIVDSAKNVYTGGHYISTASNFFFNSNISSSNGSVLPSGAQLSGCNAQVAYVTKTNNSGQLQYALSMYAGGAKCNASTMNALAVDSGDNLYMTGRFGIAGTSLVYGSNMALSNSNTLSLWSDGVLGDAYASYVLKFNTNGELALKYGLAVRSNTTSFVEGTGIKIDSTNHVINVGNYRHTSVNNIYNFEPNGTTATFAALPTTAGAVGSYLRKHNSSTGALVWSAAIANNYGSGSNVINGVALDSANNIYVVGNYTGNSSNITFYSSNVTTCNTTNNNKIRTAAGQHMAYVAKYTANGAFVCVSSLNATLASGSGIAIDTLDNVYITGIYTSSASNTTFINSSNLSFSNCNYLPTNSSGTAQYLIKFNTNLHAQWAAAIQTSTTSNFAGAQAISIDSTNNIYLTGNLYSTPLNIRYINSNQSSSNSNIVPASTLPLGTYVTKFNSSGMFQYAVSVAGVYGNTSRTFAVKDNEMYFGGAYLSTSNSIIEYDSNFSKYYSSNIVPTVFGTTNNIATLKYRV